MGKVSNSTMVWGVIALVLTLLILFCWINACCTKSQKLKQYQATSKIIQTAKGQMEYYITGEAPYFLCLHGTPGMHDGFVQDFKRFKEAGFGYIAPSRPGYANTPLSTGPDYAGQADACAALLDSLEIDKVHVFAYSGGGPCAIHFAARHPSRMKCLILQAANTGNFDDPRTKEFENCCFKMVTTSQLLARTFCWLASKFPWWFLRNIMLPGLAKMTDQELDAEVARMRNDPNFKLAEVTGMAEATWQLVLYPRGYDNMVHEFHMWKEHCPFGDVKCPTHISHGTKDGDPPSHAYQAHEGIKGSELRIIEGAWHVVELHPEFPSLWAEQLAFIEKHKDYVHQVEEQ